MTDGDFTTFSTIDNHGPMDLVVLENQPEYSFTYLHNLVYCNSEISKLSGALNDKLVVDRINNIHNNPYFAEIGSLITCNYNPDSSQLAILSHCFANRYSPQDVPGFYRSGIRDYVRDTAHRLGLLARINDSRINVYLPDFCHYVESVGRRASIEIPMRFVKTGLINPHLPCLELEKDPYRNVWKLTFWVYGKNSKEATIPWILNQI